MPLDGVPIDFVGAAKYFKKKQQIKGNLDTIQID